MVYKKVLAIVTLIFAIFCFVNFPVKAGIDDAILDQYYDPYKKTGSWVIYTNPNIIQTFKPTVNKIVAVHVYLKDRLDESTIILKIIDMTTGQAVITSSHVMVHIFDGWEMFNFSAPYANVTPGNTYGIKLNTYDEVTRWYYGANGYANGAFQLDPNLDTCFKVYGLQTEEPTPETTTTTTVSAGESEQVDDSQDGGGEDSSESQDLTSDQSIPEPSLSYIEKNGERIDVPIDTVEVNQDGTLRVFGTSAPLDIVILSIGNMSFSTVADENGNWEILIDYSSLDEGESYDINAQAQNDELKESDVVKLFSLKVSPAGAVGEEEGEQLPASESNNLAVPFIIGISLLLVAGIVILAIYFLKKKRKIKSLEGEAKPIIEGEKELTEQPLK